MRFGLRTASEDGSAVAYELPFPAGRWFRVTQGYGGEYSHTDRLYFAIDFAMPEGTEICAARTGIVFRVVDHFTEGGPSPALKQRANEVSILHDDDTMASYFHLRHRGARVRPGDYVPSGYVIGFSGNTGRSSGPHLHFHVADAIDRQTIPTLFRTWCGLKTLREKKAYTRPWHVGHGAPLARRNIRERIPAESESNEPDGYAFHPELLNECLALPSELAECGFERGAEYESVAAMHDVHGVEVCGIRSAELTLMITRFLLRRFSGWNASWSDESDFGQSWVARIQRDRDIVEDESDSDDNSLRD